MPPQSPSDKSGWRGGAKGQPRRGPAAGQKGWTKRKDRQYEHAVYRHRARLAASGLLLIGLIAALIYYLLPSWKRTPFVCVTVTDYAGPVPPNPWAVEDLRQFAGMDKKVLTYTQFQWGSAEERLADLRAKLDEASPGGPAKDLIIVYLSMHGVVDGENQPCLLPPGATPSRPESWLRVSDLLDCLRQRKGVKKLLILDANRMDINWGLGLLYNDFAGALERLVRRNEDPDLIVLNSTSPGQIGWTAPELSGSLFGYFLWRGLRSEADANQDNRVSARELDRYLKVNVEDWSTAHRDDTQTPMLIMPPGMDDYLLVHTRRPQIPQPEPAIEDLPQEVADLWERHEQLARTAEPYRLNPLKWEQFQEKLLRLEQLAQGGPACQTEFRETRTQLMSLARELQADTAVGNLATCSLPLASLSRPWDARETEDAQRAFRLFFEQPGDQGPPRGEAAAGGAPGEAGGEQPAGTAQRNGGPPNGDPAAADDADPEAPPQSPQPAPQPEGPPTYGRPAAAEAALDWAIGNAQDRDDLGRALAFAGMSDPRGEPVLVELLQLWMLQTYLDPRVWDLPGQPGYVNTALRVRRLAEQSAAPRDERTQYWIRDTVDQADASRRIAEDELLVGGDVELAEAARLWEQSEGGEPAGKGYSAAIQRAADLAQVLQTRDEAWAKTPHLARWVLSRLRKTPADQSALAEPLRALIVANHQLAEALDASLESGQVRSDLGTIQETVRANLEILLSEFSKSLDLEVAGGDAAKLRRIAIVLTTPLVTGDARTRLWQQYVAIASSIPSALPVEAGHKTQSESTEAASTDPSAYLGLLADGGWAEHPALTIVRLAGQQGIAAAPPALEPREQWTQERLAAEGRDLRLLLYGGPQGQQPGEGSQPQGIYQRANLWLGDSRDKAAASDSAAAARGGCNKADRLVRASAAVLGPWAWPYAGPDPTNQLRLLDLHYLMLWHADRTLEDFWGPAAADPRPYFEIAAGAYLKSASRLLADSARQDAVEQRLARLLAAARQSPTPTVPPRPVDENDEVIDHSATVASDRDLPAGEAAFYLQDSSQPDRAFPLLHGGSLLDRLPIVVPGSDGQRVEFRIPTEGLQGAAGLQGVALYRGHVRLCPCRFPPDEGWDVEYVPLQTFRPRITLLGDAAGSSSVVLILDCSGSMGLHVGGIESNPRRIDVARGELKYILRRLVEGERGHRVGVMAYSHRAAWDKAYYDQTGKIRIAYRTADRAHPCVDVEWLLEPDTLTAPKEEALSGELDLLRPGGSTPLYLAIIKAIREHRLPGENRQVVVITDGLNDQLVDLSGLSSEEVAAVRIPDVVQVGGRSIRARQELSDLKAELAGDPNVRLDVIGFELNFRDVREGDQASYRVFHEFLGERFYDASSAEQLRSAVLGALAPPDYEVLSLPDRLPAADPVELGATTTVQKGAKGEYLVRLADPKRALQAEVELEGNEWLRLQLSRDWEHLIFQHLGEPDDRRGSPILVVNPNDAAGPSRLYVQAHRPHREDAAVAQFEVSFWSDNEEEFTLRPKEVWMQIMPLGEGAEADFVRVFYDRSFKADYPAPRLSYVARNWPADAAAAEIQLWLNYGEAYDTTSRPLSELLQDTPEAAPLSIAGVAVEARIRPPEQPTDPCRIEIKQTHPPDGPLDYVKVDMTPTPEKVIRHFSPLTRTVRHTFIYRGVSPDSVRHYSVHFTTEDRLKQLAASLPKPLVVDVPPPGR